MAEVKVSDPVTLFYCYAREDRRLLEKLEKHLAPWRLDGLIEDWSDRKASPGSETHLLMERHLNTADIILLLISPEFTASEYCNNALVRALERHNAGEAWAIPILLRPANVQDTRLRNFPMILSSSKPITKWRIPDEALKEFVEGMRPILKDAWMKKGDIHYQAKRYYPALAAFKNASDLYPEYGLAWRRRGCVLRDLWYQLRNSDHYQEAIDAFNEAIRYDSKDASAHYLLGTLRYDNGDYKLAASSLEKAIQLDPLLVSAHIYLGLALGEQGAIRQALDIYQRYLQIHPGDPVVTYFGTYVSSRYGTKEFHRETRHIVEQFLKGVDDYYRHYHQFSDTREEPIQLFISTIHMFRAGLQGFQQSAQTIANDYSSWLRNLRWTFETTWPEQEEAFDVIENPEIKELLLTLLDAEAHDIYNQTSLIDEMCHYLQSLKDRGVDTIDHVIEEWARALRQLSDRLEVQQAQSQELLDVLRDEDSKRLDSDSR